MKKTRSKTRHYRRVQVRFRAVDDTDWNIGFTTNVSSTGMFVSTGRPLPVGV